ncbi:MULTISPECIES: L-seryl-tRNA(Sec) selenium transferase [unclassified Haematobacter]|uniref:L-seryl-tRNA(Sec) selenium transferase n=1 Tax=unclassified Haematobacter TaxID=2640585 RepID=UPI0025BB5592|nr:MULTISPECIES: L-seryl-tRNA(Sec) selenium transferase [unclassified Haematobacter]
MRGLRALPSVDRLLATDTGRALQEAHGRQPVTDALRALLGEAREAALRGAEVPAAEALLNTLADRLHAAGRSALRPVLNLTGTVLHTNLGRALLAEEAVQAAAEAMRAPAALELDLSTGRRGERDAHLRQMLCDLTGAEDATVVNNNAAAVLITLNTLGAGREAIVSRGELIEIGGAFRMPDIMESAGVRLREVGTTNRTHLRDYERALTEATGMVLKVHPSNYRIEGFTASVTAAELAPLALRSGVPLVNDLGSGTLIDMARLGLPPEPTVREAVAEGADIVTFSGDKLLGGPQAGFIVGRADLIARINRNPLKRALRLDKIRIAALAATLRLYGDGARAVERLPTLRLLRRGEAEIRAQAERLCPQVAALLPEGFQAAVTGCESQIGSGALPVETLASAGLRLTGPDGKAPERLATALRAQDRPVLGRIADGALILDLRCLEEDGALTGAMAGLR